VEAGQAQDPQESRRDAAITKWRIFLGRALPNPPYNFLRNSCPRDTPAFYFLMALDKDCLQS